jgi:transcription termination/antitermination protein NusG
MAKEKEKGRDYDAQPIYLDKPDDDFEGRDLLDDSLPPSRSSTEKMWYVVHCYSGQEKKVQKSIEQRIETMGMGDKIFDVIVPTEEEIEVKDGKRRNVEKRVFPGYLLVEMLLDEDEPTPLRVDEVKQIMSRMLEGAPVVKPTYKVGQKVRIIDGPFNDFIGTVAAIDTDKSKVRVMVNFFGRDTPVELDFLEVEKQ